MSDKTTTTIDIEIEQNGEIDITVLEKVAGGVSMPTLQKKPEQNNQWALQHGNEAVHDASTGGGAVQPGDVHGSVSTTLAHGSAGGVSVDATAGASGQAGVDHSSTSVSAHAGGQAGITATVGLGHGVSVTETAGASGSATAHAGPTGVGVAVTGTAGRERPRQPDAWRVGRRGR